MGLIYHNITPPEYFAAVHRTLARECFRGRRELHAYIDRCDLAMGDSEFNRQDLEALGFPRTAVLPVYRPGDLDDPATVRGQAVRRRLDEHPVCRAVIITRRRGLDPFLSRLPVQFNPRSRC
jgi:hypothetical protein